jgi:hypothetical protein
MLYISEADIKKCEAIGNPDALSVLTEQEIEMAIKDGYYKARDEKWAPSRDVPQRAIEVLRITWGTDPVPPEVLIQIAEELLNTGRQHTACSNFVDQLDKCLGKLKNK